MRVRSLAYRYAGFLSLDREDGLRLTWLEVCPRRQIALSLHNWGDDGHFTLHIGFIFFAIYLRLPFFRREPTPMQMGDTWGFSWTFGHELGGIHLNWCQRCKIIPMPWHFKWYRTSYLLTNRNWFHDTEEDQLFSRLLGGSSFSRYNEINKLPKWSETLPYKYLLRSGEVQERTAKIEVREYERRRRWLFWTPWFAKVQQSIDVEFSDEVGERSGSWKGGTTGCGWDIRPGETPARALKRMEQERKF